MPKKLFKILQQKKLFELAEKFAFSNFLPLPCCPGFDPRIEEDIEEILSGNMLNVIESSHGKDLWWANDIKHNDNKFSLDIQNGINYTEYDRLINMFKGGNFDGRGSGSLQDWDIRMSANKQIMKIVKEFNSQTNTNFTSSGFFYYPKNSWLGWHNNANYPGRRVYLVWAQEDHKSFFRHRNPETNELVTKWEKKGWQVNTFTVPTWHCVGSYTNRISIGFREMGKKKKVSVDGKTFQIETQVE